VLSSANGAAGPGGADFFTDTAGDLWLAYHAWSGSRIGYPAGGSRSLRIDRVAFAQGRPWIDGPSTDVRPFSLHPGPPRAVPSHPAPGAPSAPPPPTPAAPSGAPPPAASATATPAVGAAALPATPGPAVPAVERADGAEHPGPSPRGDPASRSPSRTGPAALAAVLAASVAAAGARQLRLGNPTALRARTAPCPSGPGPSPPPGS
jgi:hypothetical protein